MDLEQIRGRQKGTLLQFAIPSVIAMVLVSMITVVDGYFIGNDIGAAGLAAVNLGLPILYLYLAVGLMLSVGGSSLAGRLLGAGDLAQTNSVFRITIATTAIVTALVTLFFSLNLRWVGRLFCTDAQTLEHFMQYYGILIFELPLMVLGSSFGMFIRGEGSPLFVMLSNVINVLLNTVLDALFIRQFHWGVAGIAWASLLSAGVVFLIDVWYFLFRSKVFHFGRFRFSRSVLQEMVFNGCSEFIGELAMCLSAAAYNVVILERIGVSGLAAFTIVGYVSYLYSMVVVGFGQSIVPLESFVYGAKEYSLAIQLRKTTNTMLGLVAIIVLVAMSLLANNYARLFSAEQEIVSMVIPGLRIQLLSFLFMGFNAIGSFYFTAIGKAKESAVISASRGLVVLLACIFTL
ncbi:MAG: MATE family efflux transporter, partial [Eubacteriales bacterium]|nr:MATE family efflux transporter [Eubacteriales bacterium]